MRARTTEDRSLLELLDPVAQVQGLEIVRLRLMGGQRRRLQIMAERIGEHDINVEQCAQLSRAVSEVLDSVDPIAGEYMLEISSPGIDRPLTRPEDFEAFTGLEARLETDRLVEGRRRFRGRLAGREGEQILIDLDGEDETALIPFAWLAEAKLVIADDLMKRSRPSAANDQPAQDDTPVSQGQTKEE